MRVLLAVALVATVLAGCVGVPEGTVGHGSQATLQFTATDPDTGAVITDPLTGQPMDGLVMAIQVGAMRSGFGSDFENRLVGLRLDESRTFTIAGDANPFPETVAVGRVFGPSSAVTDVPRTDFVGFIQQEPEVGLVFPLTFFDAVVESFNETIVTYRVTPEPGQSDPVPEVGSNLLTTVAGDELTQTLEPVVGATFAIQPSQQGQTPLGLAPGSYQAVGADGDQLILAHNPTTTYHALLGRPVTFEVTVLAVQTDNVDDVPVNGNYGVTASPHFNTDAGRVPAAMPGAPATGGHDDGHGHGDHTH